MYQFTEWNAVYLMTSILLVTNLYETAKLNLHAQFWTTTDKDKH